LPVFIVVKIIFNSGEGRLATEQNAKNAFSFEIDIKNDIVNVE